MSQPDHSSEQAKRAQKIKQFSVDFDRLIRSGSSAPTHQANTSPTKAPATKTSPTKTHQSIALGSQLLSILLGLGLVALVITLLALLGYWLLSILPTPVNTGKVAGQTGWATRPSLLWILLLLVGLLCPPLCQVYGLIVGGFTALLGVKLAFVVGQSFSVLPALPFLILEPRLSYFYLGWGLLVASRKSRSGLGFGLALLNLLGGALGLFLVKSSTTITLPGIWGSLLSGLLTIGLGCSTVKTILRSWQPQTQDS
jgi:hypothetical protein